MVDLNVESVVAEGVNALGESVIVSGAGGKLFYVRYADKKAPQHVVLSASSLESLEKMGYKLKSVSAKAAKDK